MSTFLTLAPDAMSKDIFNRAMRAPGQPIVLRGAATAWTATRLWTFDYFIDRYGDDKVHLADCLLHPTHRIEVQLREYIEYVRTPGGSRLQGVARKRKLAVPFYAYGYRPFAQHPELLDHFSLPDYVHDWCRSLPPETRRSIYPFGIDWLLFSSPGATSRLHRDDASTIAWFAQIQGSKRFVVHSLEDRPFLYEGQVDPLSPDLSTFPDYARSHPVELVLEPGDMLYLPPDWYHHVVTLSPSITVTGNVVNEVNLGDYVRHAYGDRLPDILALLPPA